AGPAAPWPQTAQARPRRQPARGARGGSLLDDLVGAGEDRWRNLQAERLSRLEVDHQFESGRLLDRQIGRLSAFEDLPSVYTLQVVEARKARAIVEQPAGVGEVARKPNRWNGMLWCQRRDLGLKAVGAKDEPIG